MPSPRAWNDVTLEDTNGNVHEHVNVTISRAGKAVVASRASRSTLLERDGASTVTFPERKKGVVMFVDGGQWKVTIVGCGCGGSR